MFNKQFLVPVCGFAVLMVAVYGLTQWLTNYVPPMYLTMTGILVFMIFGAVIQNMNSSKVKLWRYPVLSITIGLSTLLTSATHSLTLSMEIPAILTYIPHFFGLLIFSIFGFIHYIYVQRSTGEVHTQSIPETSS